MPGRLGLIVNPTSGKNTGARIGVGGADPAARRGRRHPGPQRGGRPQRHGAGSRGRRLGRRGPHRRRRGRRDGAPRGEPRRRDRRTSRESSPPAPATTSPASWAFPVRDAAKAVERILAGGTRAVDAGASHDADGGGPLVPGGARRRVRRRRQRARQPDGGGRRARCATTSRSCASCPVFRAIPYVLELDGRPHRDRGDARRGRQRAVLRRRHAGHARTPRSTTGSSTCWCSAGSPRRVPPGLPEGLPRRPHEPPRGGGASGARRCGSRPTGIVSYADGERFAPLPMTMEVVPGALHVLA